MEGQGIKKISHIITNYNGKYILEEINGGFTADTPRYVQSLADQDAIHDSPIDINITKTEPILMPPLNWYNLEVTPKKMKITNTGYTRNLPHVLSKFFIFS